MTAGLSAPTRRALLSGGALVVSFALLPEWAREAAAQAPGAEAGKLPLPGSLAKFPLLDSWIAIDGTGGATVCTGKAELGQGIATALAQVAAEELDIAFGRVALVTADTGRTPDEGLTAGSHSMQDSGTAVANAAANVRMLLLRAAAARWGLPDQGLATDGTGAVAAPDGRRLGYGALADGLSLHVEAVPDAPRRDPAHYRTMGHDLPRPDIPAKLTGGAAYLQDMRLPGMLHARVIRGPSYGTRLSSVEAVEQPGVTVVRNGDFAALVADTEWAAVTALRHLQRAPATRTRPLPADSLATLQRLPAQTNTVLDTHDAVPPAVRTLKARYTRPWLAHASVGPSCAVAQYADGQLTVWTHTQGVFLLRGALAGLTGLPKERVRCIHVPGSGCYGHNGADDVAGDAALVALATPGRPIRLQWMREQEFGWEPLSSTMATEVEASLDAGGHVTSWTYDVWSAPHNDRPFAAGGLLAGREVSPPFPAQPLKPLPMPEGGGDRNSNPLYALPNMHVLHHFVTGMPLRASALRSLGAYHNVFSIESMMDELAHAAGADPLAFRLAHMGDERARAVMVAATEAIGWGKRPKGDGRGGFGLGFARYKNLGAYCAVAMEVALDRETGAVTVARVHAAVDSGQAASPDGIRNQVEGGIVQSLSWTRHEAVRFDAERQKSFDWSGYPIARFSDVPGAVHVAVMARPGLPFLGTGEASQGPTAAAYANALADATGIRFRELPLTADKVKAAIGTT